MLEVCDCCQTMGIEGRKAKCWPKNVELEHHGRVWGNWFVIMAHRDEWPWNTRAREVMLYKVFVDAAVVSWTPYK